MIHNTNTIRTYFFCKVLHSIIITILNFDCEVHNVNIYFPRKQKSMNYFAKNTNNDFRYLNITF